MINPIEEINIRNDFHILFNCSDLLHNRRLLSSICSTNNIPFTLSRIFQSSNVIVIKAIIKFFPLQEVYILMLLFLFYLLIVETNIFII